MDVMPTRSTSRDQLAGLGCNWAAQQLGLGWSCPYGRSCERYASLAASHQLAPSLVPSLCSYGNDFDPQGQFTPGKVGAWHWDKRDWTVRDFFAPLIALLP